MPRWFRLRMVCSFIFLTDFVIAQKVKFDLRVTFEDGRNGYCYLSKNSDHKLHRFQVVRGNGIFGDTMDISKPPVFANLYFSPYPNKSRLELKKNYQSSSPVQFIIEAGSTEIIFENNKNVIVASDGTLNKEYTEYTAQESRLNYLTNSLIKRLDQGSEQERQEVLDSLTVCFSLRNSYPLLFIKEHPDSYFSLFLLEKFTAMESWNNAIAKEMISSLSGNIRNMKRTEKAAVKIFKKGNELKTFKDTLIDIVLVDHKGSDFSLKQLKRGRYLVEFGASWCMPCKAVENRIQQNLSQLNGNGIDIVSISLDVKKENWLKSVRSNNYSWIQLNDENGWESQLVKRYGISSIPFALLVSDGKIEAYDVKVDQLLIKD